MENHSSRVPSEKEEIALFNDLGSFEGFSFRDQQAIERDLSAEQVVNWDHDEDGEAEFWPAGDRPGVQLIFEGASSLSAREIVALDELLQELGDDEVETYARIYAAMSYHGRNITELTAEEVEDLSAHSPCQRTFTFNPPPTRDTCQV